jgi:hypothetical protein
MHNYDDINIESVIKLDYAWKIKRKDEFLNTRICGG